MSSTSSTPPTDRLTSLPVELLDMVVTHLLAISPHTVVALSVTSRSLNAFTQPVINAARGSTPRLIKVNTCKVLGETLVWATQNPLTAYFTQSLHLTMTKNTRANIHFAPAHATCGWGKAAYERWERECQKIMEVVNDPVRKRNFVDDDYWGHWQSGAALLLSWEVLPNLTRLKIEFSFPSVRRDDDRAVFGKVLADPRNLSKLRVFVLDEENMMEMDMMRTVLMRRNMRAVHARLECPREPSPSSPPDESEPPKMLEQTAPGDDLPASSTCNGNEPPKMPNIRTEVRELHTEVTMDPTGLASLLEMLDMCPKPARLQVEVRLDNNPQPKHAFMSAMTAKLSGASFRLQKLAVSVCPGENLDIMFGCPGGISYGVPIEAFNPAEEEDDDEKYPMSEPCDSDAELGVDGPTITLKDWNAVDLWDILTDSEDEEETSSPPPRESARLPLQDIPDVPGMLTLHSLETVHTLHLPLAMMLVEEDSWTVSPDRIMSLPHRLPPNLRTWFMYCRDSYLGIPARRALIHAKRNGTAMKELQAVGPKLGAWKRWMDPEVEGEETAADAKRLEEEMTEIGVGLAPWAPVKVFAEL